MLESIRIRNIALIEDITIRFHNGMQVLTGETGAGKSIVVDSVNLILGGRAEKEMIRSGCEKASVEAIFHTDNNDNVRTFMDNEEIEYDGQTVTVFREITASGRNVCRICGVIIPVSKLKELAQYLLDLHGQSEHQFLTDQDKQLVFLDQTGDLKHRELMKRTQEACERFLENHRTYAGMVRENKNREERMKSLEHDLAALRKASIRQGEASELIQKRKTLAEAEKKREALLSVRECFFGNDENASGLDQIRQASEKLKNLASSDNSVQEISRHCESVFLEMEEIAYQISLMTDKTENETAELEKTENRLELIHRIERKYGVDSDEIPSFLKKEEKEYEYLAELDERIRKMSAEHKRLLSEYRTVSGALSESRRAIARGFENRMSRELQDLGMGNTRFSVEFKENETGKPIMPTVQGDDRIEFLISPNPGEPLKSLARIASGGELSRLMLAVKTLESDHTGVESMVFDEIDTGISGRMAQTVAEKMISISRKRQVICVTHLPQIAAAADYHFMVEKTVLEGRTNTSVKELDSEGRTQEIGRMISGADGITSETSKYAKGMIEAAEEKKRQIS